MTTAVVGDRFDIGRVISRTFGVLGRNAPAFILAAMLLSAAPHVILAFVSLTLRPSGGSFSLAGAAVALGSGLLSLLTTLVALVAAVLLQGALIFATVSDLNGRRPSFEEMLQVALRVALPLIGVGLLVGLGVALGLILLIVPGVILALMWCVATPARVVEPIGVMTALARSRELTRGHRWMILLLFIIVLVINWVILAILGAVGLAASGITALITLATMTPTLGSPLWIGMVIVQPIVQALVSLLAAAGVASLYYELRSIKDGVGAEALAAAFA
jgi:hypothetical protein